MKQKDLILKRFDNLNFLKASHEIVKYSPEYYDENGVYQRNEWTAFSDIGKEYEGKVVTKEDYLDVENRFIDITQSILKAAGCTYQARTSLGPAVKYVCNPKRLYPA